MPRVLIATDEPNFSLGLVEGYRALGWDVVMGAKNFRLRAAHYDLIHHQWPEEFSSWGLPTAEQIEEISAYLQWWSSRTINIFSVNNLYPHQYERHPCFHKFYSRFYQHCQLITHYSNASLRLVLQEFQLAHKTRHVVHAPPNYEVTLANQRRRGSWRADFGIRDEEFVMLMLGSLRSWDEVRLIQRAYDLARIPNKRLLMAGKFKIKETTFHRRWKQCLWKAWLKSRNAIVDTRYVPEGEISQFIDSCDIAIVPRLSGLSSAIPLLAMTFGRAFVAPRHGAYPDYVQKTRNLLYETGSPKSLAEALEQAATLNLKEIGQENAAIAATWTWKRMVRTCLEAVAQLDTVTAAPIRAFLVGDSKDEKAM
jgi:hypothetical protein